MKKWVGEGVWRVAWAVVQMGDEGQLQAVMQGPVWAPLPQTVGAAEHVAFAALAQLANGCMAVADYRAVVDAYRLGEQVLWGNRRYAGVLRDARLSEGYGRIREVVWQKAHVQVDGMEGGGWLRARANELVDEYAKSAVELHP
eukprot:6373996-Lingulodinium_polyedra.AAC.1